MADELDALKRKRMIELQQRLMEENSQQEQMAQYEDQIRGAIQQILTPEARARLATIKMAKPEYATQIELMLIQIAQGGQLQNKITDEQLKGILKKIAEGSKKEFNIRRM